MKLDNNNNLETSKNISKNKININEESVSKIIGLMSKNIYADPYSAFREYWLNARESVDMKYGKKSPKDQGQSIATPIEIMLPYLQNNYYSYGNNYNISHSGDSGEYKVIINPNDEERRFFIRDYGMGMTQDELIKMIANAGDSTKNTTNDFGGGMGIGSLSGFSVADYVTYIAYKDGKKSTLILTADTNDYAVLPIEETDAPDGVRVEFELRDDADINKFSKGAIEFLNLAPIDEQAVIYYNKKDVLNKHSDLATERFGNTVQYIPNSNISEILFDDTNINISINGCYYKGVYNKKVANDVFSEVFNELNDYNGYFGDYYRVIRVLISKYVWNVPVGYFNDYISPSRETISINDKYLKVFFEKIKEDIRIPYDKYIEYKEVLKNSDSVKSSLEDILYIDSLNKDINKVFSDKNQILYELNIVTIDFNHSVFKRNCNYVSFIAPAGDGLSKKSTQYFDIKVNGIDNTYRVTTGSAYYDKQVEISLYNISDTCDSIKYNVLSTSQQLDECKWKERISDIKDNGDLSKVKDKDSLEAFNKIKDSNFAVSSPAYAKVQTILADQGLPSDLHGEIIDGVHLRNVYSNSMKKKKSKKKEVKYLFNTIGNNGIQLSIEELADKYPDTVVYVYPDDNENKTYSDTWFSRYSETPNIIGAAFDDNSLVVNINNTYKKYSVLIGRLEKNNIAYKKIEDITYDEIIDNINIDKGIIDIVIINYISNGEAMLISKELDDVIDVYENCLVDIPNELNVMNILLQDIHVESDRTKRIVKSLVSNYYATNGIDDLLGKYDYDIDKITKNINIIRKLSDSSIFSSLKDDNIIDKSVKEYILNTIYDSFK